MEGRKKIREVWEHNVAEEFALIAQVIREYRWRYISLDTEFPGFIRNTPRTVSGKELYEDLKFNVDSMKLIQVGLCFSDGRGNLPFSGGVWQFNLRDFNPLSDPHGPGSIEFLTNSGIDLTKNMNCGIDSEFFTKMLVQTRLIGNPNICWITFHGCYDFAYLIKLLTGKPLPTQLDQFLDLRSSYFRKSYDLKIMAKYCVSFCDSRRLGLQNLARIFKVEKVGISHQAGSDSLLTSSTFGKMRWRLEYQGYCMVFGAKNKFSDLVYGLELDLDSMMGGLTIS